MPTVVIHIGAPRTGTTTLQKNIFNLSQSHAIIQKNPYASSGNSAKANAQTQADELDIAKLLDSPEGREIIFRENIMLPAVKLAVDPSRIQFTRSLLSAATQIVRSTSKQVLISSERLCDSSASLKGDSRHDEGGDKCFGIFPLSLTLKQANLTPLIITCLRSPIAYLRSKWTRTTMLRKMQKTFHLQQNPVLVPELFLKMEDG